MLCKCLIGLSEGKGYADDVERVEHVDTLLCLDVDDIFGLVVRFDVDVVVRVDVDLVVRLDVDLVEVVNVGFVELVDVVALFKLFNRSNRLLNSVDPSKVCIEL